MNKHKHIYNTIQLYLCNLMVRTFDISNLDLSNRINSWKYLKSYHPFTRDLT